VVLRVGQLAECAGHAVEVDPAGDHRRGVDLALGQHPQALLELARVVGEHEVEAQLLGAGAERRHPVGLHAHADDDDPRAGGGVAQDVVEDPRDPDGLEHRGRGRAPHPGPGLERRLDHRVDNLVGTHGGGHRPAGRRQVGGHDRGDAPGDEAARTARPTGPQPRTTAPSPGAGAAVHAWSPTATGSVSAATRGQAVGHSSSSGADSSMRSPYPDGRSLV
jgi:hypothetical protein